MNKSPHIKAQEEALGVFNDWDRLTLSIKLMNRIVDDGRLSESEAVVLRGAIGAAIAIQIILEAMQVQIDRLTEAVLK